MKQLNLGKEGGRVDLDHAVCTILYYLALTIAHITRVDNRGEREREKGRLFRDGCE